MQNNVRQSFTSLYSSSKGKNENCSKTVQDLSKFGCSWVAVPSEIGVDRVRNRVPRARLQCGRTKDGRYIHHLSKKKQALLDQSDRSVRPLECAKKKKKNIKYQIDHQPMVPPAGLQKHTCPDGSKKGFPATPFSPCTP